MKNFIESYDNALTSEQCKLIIDYMNEGVWSGLLKRGEMFGGIDINKPFKIHSFKPTIFVNHPLRYC